MYTHFSVSDSLNKSDIEFTNKQINNFYNLVNELKKDNYNVGKIHIQSSYGILNYPELECDYVRPGIIMYGVYSSNTETKIRLNLKPVLTLKARITSIKEIEKDESVSYGRKFKSNKVTKIATVSIGYADGYPRNLSCKGTRASVKDRYAEIIGKICMDQLIINVTNIDVKIGDILTLINENIRAEDIVEATGTITNELLSRLGSRLEYNIICK